MNLTLTRDEDSLLAIWKNEKGEIVAGWNDDAIIHYPEDVTSYRDIGDLVKKVYEKGLEDGVNSVLEKL